MQYLKEYTNYVLYLPESFEWLILKSGIIREDNLADILNNPSEYIESKEYFSWERFFTDLISKITSGSEKGAQYNKSHIAPYYIISKNIEKILKQIENIKF